MCLPACLTAVCWWAWLLGSCSVNSPHVRRGNRCQGCCFVCALRCLGLLNCVTYFCVQFVCSVSFKQLAVQTACRMTNCIGWQIVKTLLTLNYLLCWQLVCTHGTYTSLPTPICCLCFNGCSCHGLRLIIRWLARSECGSNWLYMCAVRSFWFWVVLHTVDVINIECLDNSCIKYLAVAVFGIYIVLCFEY